MVSNKRYISATTRVKGFKQHSPPHRIEKSLLLNRQTLNHYDFSQNNNCSPFQIRQFPNLRNPKFQKDLIIFETKRDDYVTTQYC